MRPPTVSIGLPVRNGGEFLQRAVTCILRQDFEDFELVIADNASDDGTEAICRQFARMDARVRYYRAQADIGLVGNFNKVFHLARGKYFKWQASDDECHAGMIRRCVKTLDAAPDTVAMVYPLGELIDSSGIVLESPLDRIESRDRRPHRRVAHLMRTVTMVDPLFGVIKAEYLRRTRLLGPFFGGDCVLLAELAMLGEIREVDEVLFRLRGHDRRTMKVYKTSRERARLYDPAAKDAWFVLPSWERMVLELLKGAGRAQLPLTERMRCGAAMLATHYGRRIRNAGGRWKRRLKASSIESVGRVRNAAARIR